MAPINNFETGQVGNPIGGGYWEKYKVWLDAQGLSDTPALRNRWAQGIYGNWGTPTTPATTSGKAYMYKPHISNINAQASAGASTPQTNVPSKPPTTEEWIKKMFPQGYSSMVEGREPPKGEQFLPKINVTPPSMKTFWRDWDDVGRGATQALIESTGVPWSTFMDEAGLDSFKPGGYRPGQGKLTRRPRSLG